MDLGNRVDIRSNVYENIFHNSVKKEVNLSSLHHKEEKEMEKLFHIKIQVKNIKVDALFNCGSQANLIADDLVNKLGLEVQYHSSPYRLEWMNKDDISAYVIDEVELDVVPFDVCGVVFQRPYLYMRSVIFMCRANEYFLIKDVNYYIFNKHKGKLNISLVSANKYKKLIISSKKYAFIFLG
jgi:hypothetical protein